MNATNDKSLSLALINIGFKRVGSWWNYKNVISPFYRLYYIEAGHARVTINDQVYDLTPGTLFLIPKFAFHSYSCEGSMDHYYMAFFDDMDNSPGIPNPYQMLHSIKAQPADPYLVKRLYEINPNRELNNTDPKEYGSDRSIYERKYLGQTLLGAASVESNGILLQLFSRFISERCLHGNVQPVSGYKNMKSVVEYIHENLERHINISELAGIMCLSADHFSKVFKKVMGITPSEYIITRRIERAEALLLTSNMNISQIALCIGISNPAQFTRLFTKATHYTPREFRLKHNQMKEMSRNAKRAVPEGQST